MMYGGGGYPPAGPGMGYPIRDHYVQQDPAWDDSAPIEQFLTQVFTKSWFRMEYMLWDIDAPGNVFLGGPFPLNRAPGQGGSDPRNPFPISDFVDGSDRGVGIIPDLSGISLNDISSIRGTMGIPFRNGSMEFSIWGTEQMSSGTGIDGLIAARQNENPAVNDVELGTELNPSIVLPLLFDNTQAGDRFLIFNDRFSSTLTSQLWGAEANVFSGAYSAGEGVKFEPMVGFRYINLDEGFVMSGEDSRTAAFRDSTIDSQVQNNLYGPSAGFRLAMVHRWFTIEATPRVSFALNNHSSSVAFEQGTTTDTGTTVISSYEDEDDVDFSTIFQVSGNLRLHVTKTFSIFGGYDALWIYRLSRAYDNVLYNSDATSPVIGLANDNESMFVHGFSIGGELRF